MCQELEDGEDQEDKEGKRSHDCVDVVEIRTVGFRLLNFFFEIGSWSRHGSSPAHLEAGIYHIACRLARHVVTVFSTACVYMRFRRSTRLTVYDRILSASVG